MASRTLVREKLRAKHRERQENEVAKRTVVMCARLRRSLPLCAAGQLNIAALVGRCIDGHYLQRLLLHEPPLQLAGRMDAGG